MIALKTNGFGTAVAANVATSNSLDTTGATLLVVHVGTYAGGSAPVVTDSKGNTWTALTSTELSGGFRGRLFYVNSATPNVGTGHTFVATANGAYPVIFVQAFDDTLATPFDTGQESGLYTGSSSSSQAGSVTPSEDNCLVIASITWNDGITSPSINGGFARTDTVEVQAGSCSGSMAYLIQTTAAAANPTWSWSTVRTSISKIAVFRSSGGGPPPPSDTYPGYYGSGGWQ